MFGSDPFGRLHTMDILTQEMTVSIYVTWLHKVKDFFERQLKLYCDINRQMMFQQLYYKVN